MEGIERKTAPRVGAILGPLLFFGINLFDLDPGNPAATRMASVAALMAVWWVTETIPLFATALLPIVLYPALGILSGKETAPIYVNSLIFLFIGGFLIALAMERWNLHRRIALFVITTIGGGPARVVLGFMLSTAFLSMWISNTATAVMMMPIGLAILIKMEAEFGAERSRKFGTALMLGIAYAASVGGASTLVGTPPNLSFARIYEISFPEARSIGFGEWMIVGVPVAAIMLTLIWVLLTRVFFRSPDDLRIDRGILHREREALGPVTFEEGVVLGVFVTTALLWVFRKPLMLGIVTVPGWSAWLPYPDLIDDGTVALGMALVLFLIPARRQRGSVAGPEIITRLPWHIILLFGGGFALASGFKVTGLSDLIGQQFEGFASVPPLVMMLCICLGLTFLTELTSNLATTEMILPILASIAIATGIHPLLVMVPATLSASCAFMMPVATPPNAIVFGSERIRIPDMVRVGFWLNLCGAVVISLVFYLFGLEVFV